MTNEKPICHLSFSTVIALYARRLFWNRRRARDGWRVPDDPRIRSCLRTRGGFHFPVNDKRATVIVGRDTAVGSDVEQRVDRRTRYEAAWMLDVRSSGPAVAWLVRRLEMPLQVRSSLLRTIQSPKTELNFSARQVSGTFLKKLKREIGATG